MSERKTIQINDIALHRELKKMSAETEITVGELAEKGIKMLLLRMNGKNALSQCKENAETGQTDSSESKWQRKVKETGK